MLKNIETITAAMKLSETGPVVIVVTGDNCSPCSRLKDMLTDMDLDKYKCNIGIVNITDRPGDARSHGIRSVPTTVSLIDGKVAGALFGEQTKDKLDTFLTNAS